jgi:hypothetical protein
LPHRLLCFRQATDCHLPFPIDGIRVAPMHQRLLNQATMLGTAAILQQLPAEHSPELEQAIRESVRQAVLYYAAGLETLDRQLHPLTHGKARA